MLGQDRTDPIVSKIWERYRQEHEVRSITESIKHTGKSTLHAVRARQPVPGPKTADGMSRSPSESRTSTAKAAPKAPITGNPTEWAAMETMNRSPRRSRQS